MKITQKNFINGVNKINTAIGYAFKDSSLLMTALTHKSTINGDSVTPHGSNNERLEFLGDAVLSLVCANFLYRENQHMDEGALSRLRAHYVCQESLSTAAKAIGLGDFILSDKAMRSSGSTNSKAVLADALEAVIGAVFLDGGLKSAEDVIFHVIGRPSVKLIPTEKDAKTRLQEIIQARVKEAPKYILLDKSGPAHAPVFQIGIKINEELIAKASGENKKAAAQNAAVLALEIIAKSPQKFLSL